MRKCGVDGDTYSRPQWDGQACYGAHVVYIWAGVMEIGVLIDRGNLCNKISLEHRQTHAR